MNGETCPRCGKKQTGAEYCVQWKETDCIRYESVALNWQKVKE